MMNDVDRYITDEAVEAAHGGYLGPVPVVTALRAALPLIYPRIRADVLRELHGRLVDAIDNSYAGGRYLTAKKLLGRVEVEVRLADQAAGR